MNVAGRVNAAAPGRVLVCGDVVNDLLVKPTASVTHDSDTHAEIVARPGGSAANQAAWLAHLGVDVDFVGRAGRRDADYHCRELARFGVQANIAVDPQADTGSIVVLIDDAGGRTMFVDPGANRRLQRCDVPAELLDAARLVHVTGYSLFDPQPRKTGRWLIDEARRRGTPFTLDPSSSAFLAELGPEEFLRWTKDAALAFPNLDEARVLTGETDPMVMARVLCDSYDAVGITLGADGALVAGRQLPPTLVPAVPVAVRDTTGAGDAFCAAFLSCWLHGGGLIDSARFAVEVSARAVAEFGARPAIPLIPVL